jgi:hypothetical protein
MTNGTKRDETKTPSQFNICSNVERKRQTKVASPKDRAEQLLQDEEERSRIKGTNVQT